MNEQTVRALGFILACNARVEGMRAANQQRATCGESVAYESHDFDVEASQMEAIAHELQS